MYALENTGAPLPAIPRSAKRARDRQWEGSPGSHHDKKKRGLGDEGEDGRDQTARMPLAFGRYTLFLLLLCREGSFLSFFSRARRITFWACEILVENPQKGAASLNGCAKQQTDNNFLPNCNVRHGATLSTPSTRSTELASPPSPLVPIPAAPS